MPFRITGLNLKFHSAKCQLEYSAGGNARDENGKLRPEQGLDNLATVILFAHPRYRDNWEHPLFLIAIAACGCYCVQLVLLFINPDSINL